MCEWCDENGGKPIGCQDCGASICWDWRNVGVTESGDVFCKSCAQRNQEERDRLDEQEAAEWGWMDFDPYVTVPEPLDYDEDFPEWNGDEDD